MSTAPTKRAAPRHKKAIAISNGMVLWRGTDEATVDTDTELSWGTGAPNHTAPQGSVFIRTDASDSDLVFYRNTDGATTWEAIVGSEVTDLLAATNAWTGANTFSHATGVTTDTLTERTGAAGVTADGLLLKDGFVVATDNQGVKLGTGVDDTLLHNGTDSLWTHTTGALRLDNQAVTGATQMDLGTNTSATKFVVRSDAGTELFSVEGGGVIRAGASMWAGAPSPANPDPSVAHEFFDDFTRATFDAAEWVVTEDDVADTQAVADGQFGVLTLTCKATTDDDACQVTWATETFKLTNGKKLWFEARIKSSSGDMVNSDWFVGLMEAEDLTGVADNMPANGIGFHKEDGAATFSASSSDNGVNLQSAAVGTIVNATWIKIGLLFDGGATGAATITPYINGAAGAPIASVTYATMAEMAVLFMVRNGDATTTQTLDVDYVKVVCER